MATNPPPIFRTLYSYSLYNVQKVKTPKQEGFSKNTQISNFTEIRPVGAEFHEEWQEDGQTWRS